MQTFLPIIEEALRSHQSDVQLSSAVSKDDVYHAVKTVMRDNPDIFWFSHQWEYDENKNTIHFFYNISLERSNKAEKQIEDVVKNDFNIDFVKTLSIKEQVMYVYKWIALYCKYDIYSAYNQTIYSVFVYRNSVCTGIAKAAQYLFQLLGIESRLVFGKLKNSEPKSRHCWLIVNVEGNWYHFDPTFALPDTKSILASTGVKPV